MLSKGNYGAIMNINPGLEKANRRTTTAPLIEKTIAFIDVEVGIEDNVVKE